MIAENTKTYDLPTVMDVDALDDVRDWLSEAVAHGDVQLNAAQVSRVVTNSLLMLVSASNSAAKNNFAFTICDPSEAFSEAIERLGMNEIFSNFLEGK
ncbi:hypothetical protein MNBD_ALPHA12-336 [hydrothermal vent metagenome]|uniref:MlaB-like STAS domain-containing protein n=1 Tax=hydrothermal vent metagenome TaxID=652676 RepID=A0A3B0U943_9ZZZZ